MAIFGSIFYEKVKYFFHFLHFFSTFLVAETRNYSFQNKIYNFDLDSNGNVINYTISSSTNINNTKDEIPMKYNLSQNYPNPFNTNTTISFSNPLACKISIAIYNIKGQKIKTITDEFIKKGHHKIVWNGKDKNERLVSSGIYFYKMETDDFSKIKKATFLK